MKTFASALSDRGLHRADNEDQYLIDESLGLYVVCDGMGGHAAGEVAAERAIAFASEYISNHSEIIQAAAESPDGYLRVQKIAEEAVQTASQSLYRLAKSTTEYAGMGTTMTLLVIVREKAVMAHVGDSRLYLYRDQQVHQLSADHTLANEMVLTGAMTAEEASTSRYQHVLTRSIGPHEFVAVDTLLFDLLPGDRMLLCSDGLSNYFPDAESVSALLARPAIAERPEELIDFAKKSGGADNITAMIIQTLADSEDRPPAETQSKLNALQQTFLCQSLSVSRLLHVMNIAKTIQCAAGQHLLRYRERSAGFYLILEGRFRVVDDDVVEGELGPGDWFGENSLISPAKSSASLIAMEPARVLLIGRVGFKRLVRRLPRLGNIVLRNLSRQLSRQLSDATANRRSSMDDTGPLSGR
jgi:serine/threonine protein phosphatase PrpC